VGDDTELLKAPQWGIPIPSNSSIAVHDHDDGGFGEIEAICCRWHITASVPPFVFF